MTRVAVLRNSANPAEIGQLAAIQTAAPSLGVEVSAVGLRDAGEIERAVTEFARVPNGGLIVPGSSLADDHRELIIGLAARHQLPVVYPDRIFVTDGGLVSYGPTGSISTGARPNTSIAFSRARNQLTCRCKRRPSTSWWINLKTAKALAGLTIPASVLARADEVIE